MRRANLSKEDRWPSMTASLFAAALPLSIVAGCQIGSGDDAEGEAEGEGGGEGECSHIEWNVETVDAIDTARMGGPSLAVDPSGAAHIASEGEACARWPSAARLGEVGVNRFRRRHGPERGIPGRAGEPGHELRMEGS